MLIILSDSLGEKDLVSPVEPRVLAAIENLGIAQDEGKHLLSCSTSLKKQIGRLDGLGSRARAAYVQRVSWDLAVAQRARGEVRAYIVVEAAGTPARVDMPSQARYPMVFHVDINYFTDSSRIQAARLVAEDQRDANLYFRLLGVFCKRWKAGSRFALQRIAGGGKNTHRVFAEHACHGPTLCIVDTDIDAAGQLLKADGTAAKVIAELPVLRPPAVIDAHLLGCRELENLIPESLMMSAAPEGQQRQLVEQHRGKFGLADYVDLKKSVATDLLKWVEEFVTLIGDAELAKHFFADEWPACLSELSAVIWSWGLGPPEGKRRV